MREDNSKQAGTLAGGAKGSREREKDKRERSKMCGGRVTGPEVVFSCRGE